MSDKEYRRRKKRKESQRKDDVLPEEQSFVPQKSEQRDSDQENEDDHYAVIDHQPSKTAKLIFLLLFSVLVATTSIIFLSLWGTERGPVDIFEADHHESVEEMHDIHEEVPILHESSPDQPSLHILSPNEADEASETLEFENELYIDNRDEGAINVVTENEEENISPLVDTQEITAEDLVKDNGESLLEDQLTITTEEAVTTTVEVTSEANVEELSSTDSLSELETVSSQEQSIVLEPPEQSIVLEPPEQSVVLEPPEQSVVLEPPEQSVVLEPPEQSVVLEPPEQSVILESPSASVYENQDITNEMDFSIRQELDEIHKMIEKSPDKALLKYESILRLHPHSPRAQYGKAMVLDQMAENERSNALLEQAIESYVNVLSQKEVPKKLYILAGTRAVDRMRFRGFIQKPLKLLMEMSEKYPMDLDLKKQIGVGYLMSGQNKEAKKVLQEVLDHNNSDGFAKVHLGFILKTDENNYEGAVKLMTEGIASNEPGVVDGRFFYHLGDALSRLGRGSEAMKVYEDGVEKGVFLSAYQRSFYNVKGLTAQPWWDPESTPLVHFIRLLESNWVAIKNEAMAVINEKRSGFLPENEGLQIKGDWKQYELFARGRKNVKHCALTPFTCGLVDGMPDAASCKRGQVKFSVMEPGTHVWAHTGPTNCRLRAHLGLVVPPGAGIRVVKEIREWKEGKVILFDDSFEHEVWHKGNGLRLILIVDFWHPELTAYQKAKLSPI